MDYKHLRLVRCFRNPIATGATYTITQSASVVAKSCGQTQPSPTVTVTIPNLKASIATPIAIIPANSTGVSLTVSNQNNPTVTPTGYALNSTISCETDGAKVTLALAVTPPATAPTDPLNYKMDTGDFGTSNSFTAVPFGAHTFVLRIGGPDQASCYYAKTNSTADFNNCSALPCDNIYLLAKDQTGTETTIIPRQTGTNALKNLTLSATTYDDSPLLGVTYAWTGPGLDRPNNFTATTASIQAGMIGTYKLTLTRGTSTCSQEIALSAMPCAALPATGVNCSNEHLTGIADDPTNRLTALNPGDVVQAGDFEVTITQATGNKDGWTGKGYVKVPYLQAEVSIVLTNAVFNSCYQLTNANATADNATVVTEYDQTWGNVTSIDNILANFKSSLQEMIDIMNNFSGKCEDVRALDKAVKEYEQAFNQANSTYTETERIAMLTKISDLKVKRDQLVSCSGCSISGARIATSAEAECGAKAILCRDALKEMLGDAKEVEKIKESYSTVVYVNGYWNTSYVQKDLFGFSDGELFRKYWQIFGKDEFANSGLQFLNAQKMFFINGSSTEFSSGEERYEKGKKFAESSLKNKSSNFYQKVILPAQDDKGNYVNNIYIVSHSMGAAFSEGMIEVLSKAGIKIGKVYHFSPADITDFSANLPSITYQLDIEYDPVLLGKNMNNFGNHIKKVIHWGLFENSFGPIILGHVYTKNRVAMWDWVKSLQVARAVSTNQGTGFILTNIPNNRYYPQKICIDGIHYQYSGNASSPPHQRIYVEGRFGF